MFKATMKNGEEIYFNEVSKYAKERGYLDYYSMTNWCTEGAMVCLTVSPWELSEDWKEQTASDLLGYEQEEEDEDEEDEEGSYEVYQWFIIDYFTARNFVQFTDELIYYSKKLDMYLLGVTHWGTSWDYVLTEWKLEEE